MSKSKHDELLDQVQHRGEHEPEFMERLSPIIAHLMLNLDPRITAYAVGAAGLALHMDDIAAGRWKE